MSSPLVAGRPDGFAIAAAHQDEAELVRAFESGSGSGDVSIWLSQGLSNSYLIVTPGGRVVINTGMGFEAPVHKALYDAVDTRPVRYVILTQGHVDHVGGVDQFLEEGTDVVAQQANLACQADDERIHPFRVRRSMPFWADAVAAADKHIRKHAGAVMPAQSKPTPTLTFDDRLELDVGGLRMQLLSVPGGETIDSLVVWLPDHRVALVGNLFSALFGHMPNLVTMRGDRYRFVLPFLDSLDRVRALEPDLLLTGHFAPIEGRDVIAAELDRIFGAVRHVHDETVRGMNAGKDVYTLMREITVPDDLAIGEGYGKVDWDVRAIWEGYAGWFHARSTTELYPVPVTAVAADLALLAGGADAIAARADARADDGDLVEAIHLAELAVAAEPRNRAATIVLLRAHQLLLSDVDGRNFWETGWLRMKIDQLSKQLKQIEGGT